LIREREKTMWETDMNLCSNSIPEGLKLLRRFCTTGRRPVPSDGHNVEADLLAKELLCYRLLDVFAQVFGKGVQSLSVEWRAIPFINRLVCLSLYSVVLEPLLNAQLPGSFKLT
jgi:hypothetical protein